MTDALLYEQDGSIVTLTMNRPDLRNPISEPDMIDAFEAAVHRINGDASVRVVIRAYKEVEIEPSIQMLEDGYTWHYVLSRSKVLIYGD